MLDITLAGIHERIESKMLNAMMETNVSTRVWWKIAGSVYDEKSGKLSIICTHKTATRTFDISESLMRSICVDTRSGKITIAYGYGKYMRGLYNIEISPEYKYKGYIVKEEGESK